MSSAGEDPIYDFSPEEKEKVTENLLRITRDIHAGAYSSSDLTIHLLRDIHVRIFEGIRDHAGRIRSATWGSERLVFGPNRSVDRTKVEERLHRAFRRMREDVSTIEREPEAPLYAQAAFTLAVWAHAEIIQVHPFQDGNGRTSRCLLNLLLVRLGLRPIAVEQCKQEYVALLNRYFEDGDIQPLADGLLRVAHAQVIEDRR